MVGENVCCILKEPSVKAPPTLTEELSVHDLVTEAAAALKQDPVFSQLLANEGPNENEKEAPVTTLMLQAAIDAEEAALIAAVGSNIAPTQSQYMSMENEVDSPEPPSP